MEKSFAYQHTLLMTIAVMFLCTWVVVYELIKDISNNVDRKGRQNIKEIRDKRDIILIEVPVIVRNAFVEKDSNTTEGADVAN